MTTAAEGKRPHTIQRHVYDHVALVVMVVGLSAALTYVEVAGLPRLASVGGSNPTPAAVTTPSAPKPTTATPATTPAIAPAATTPTPPPAAVATPTATTVSFVHMRAAKTTSSPILVDLNAGTTVQLIDDSNPQWQGVSYNGQTGYIFKTYLQYAQ